MNPKQNWSEDSSIDNNARVRGFFRLRVIGARPNEQTRLEDAYAADPNAAIANSPQFRLMEACASEAGLVLRPEDVVLEFGTGAASPLEDRPVLSAMLEAAERGEFDVLVVSRPEDLWRNVTAYLAIAGRLDKAGVRLYCVGRGLVHVLQPELVLAQMWLQVRVYTRRTLKQLGSERLILVPECLESAEDENRTRRNDS